MFIYIFYSTLFKIHTYIYAFLYREQKWNQICCHFGQIWGMPRKKVATIRGLGRQAWLLKDYNRNKGTGSEHGKGKSQLQDSLREGNSLGTGHIIVQFIPGYLLFEGLICISCVFKLSWTKGLVDLFWSKIFCHCCVYFSHFDFSWTTNYFQLNLP